LASSFSFAICSGLFTNFDKSGAEGGAFSSASGSAAASFSLSLAAFFWANSSRRDSAEMLSTVLDALLTSKPRSRSNSINAAFSIPISLDN